MSTTGYTYALGLISALSLSAYRKTGEVMVQIPPAPETLIQATSWHRNAQGKIELVADKSPTQVQP